MFIAPPLLVTLIFIGLLALPVFSVQAQGVGTLTLKVDCDKGDSIQETIKKRIKQHFFCKNGYPLNAC